MEFNIIHNPKSHVITIKWGLDVAKRRPSSVERLRNATAHYFNNFFADLRALDASYISRYGVYRFEINREDTYDASHSYFVGSQITITYKDVAPDPVLMRKIKELLAEPRYAGLSCSNRFPGGQRLCSNNMTESSNSDQCRHGVCADCCRELHDSCPCGRHYDRRNCRECGHNSRCGCCTCAQPRLTGVRVSKVWEAQLPTKRKTFQSKRLAGVEWEYNNSDPAPVAAWARKWGAGLHSDGSCGYEAVTPPVAGDYIESCLRELRKAFDDGRAQIDDRCGLHVHVDAKDFKWEDIYRLIRVYAKVEPILYLLGGRGRAQNSYCKPCGTEYMRAIEQKDPKGRILEVAYGRGSSHDQFGIAGRDAVRGRPGKKSGSRYKGLNLCPWLAGRHDKVIAPDTTVEFRLHQGTGDVERVIGWTKLCVTLLDWVFKATDADVAALPNAPLKALCEVIAPKSKEWILARVKAEFRDKTETSTKAWVEQFKQGDYSPTRPLLP